MRKKLSAEENKLAYMKTRDGRVIAIWALFNVLNALGIKCTYELAMQFESNPVHSYVDRNDDL